MPWPSYCRVWWFHRASPRDRKLCVCVFWSACHTVTSIQSRAFGPDYLSNSISEDLKTLIPQSDKVPILIISPSRATRRSPWKIQSKRTNQKRRKAYKRRGERKLTFTSTDEQFTWKNNLYWTRHRLYILFGPNVKPKALDIKVFT